MKATKSLCRRLMLAALAIAICGPMLSMNVRPAAAASYPCYNLSCNGLNPSHSYNGSLTCDSNAVTVKSVTVAGGRLDLRFSIGCQAAWGRMTATTQSGTYIWKVQSSTGTQYYYEAYLAAPGGLFWTSMVGDAGSLTARAGGTMCNPNCLPESQWIYTGVY